VTETNGTMGQPGGAGGIGSDTGAGGTGGVGGAGGIGVQGEQGEQGIQGKTGSSQKAIRFADRRMLFLLLFVVVAFVAVAARSELNNRSIKHNAHRQAVYNYQQCQRSVVNTQKINATTDAQIKFLSGFLKTSPNPAGLRAFIKIYEDSKLIVPACGRTP
jgi:hypothetical protein